MSKTLKIYLAVIYIISAILLLYSWDSLEYYQLLVMLGLLFLAVGYNMDIVFDLQSNMHFLIIYPFLIPAVVYLDTFYAMLFIAVFSLFKYQKVCWYKKLYNGAVYGIVIFIASKVFHYFYQDIENISVILSLSFFVILLIVTFMHKILVSLFINTAISLEKEKLDRDAFIGSISTIKTSFLTFFLGLINVILFYYTNIVGVAVFTFFIYFIKPALQYRHIFDNELSTYTNFVLHVLKEMDPITHTHSERVKFWTVLLAQKMGLPNSEIRQLSQAASWHDIGKIEISMDILVKPGKLTRDEYDSIKSHPEKGYLLVKDMHFFKRFLPVIRHHHEFYNGTGYPMGLVGDKIPLHARIMAITDAFDAMTSDRTYRDGMMMGEAVEELIKNAGKQFDPKLVNIFVEALQDEYGNNYQEFTKEIIMNVS